MPQCVAYGCTNHSDQKKLSFHKLPGVDRKTTREACKHAIGRKSLSNVCVLCANHFEEGCFDESYDMKKRIMGLSTSKRLLKKDAVPTVFAHRKVAKSRESSVRREERKEQNQVYIFIFHVILLHKAKPP